MILLDLSDNTEKKRLAFERHQAPLAQRVCSQAFSKAQPTIHHDSDVCVYPPSVMLIA